MTELARRPSLFDDPVALEIIWGRLVAVADEMQTVLRRTAFTTIVSSANDVGCQIMDARGWSVARAAIGMPMFILGLQALVPKLLEKFPPKTLRPGDVFIANDPWISAGHLPDVGVVTPFFKGERLIGFAGSICHVADIGGLLNAQMARTVFEEGLYIPLLKLYEAGRRNETLVSIIRQNVRTPDPVMGDIMAMVTSNEVAARQTLALLDEYGFNSLEPLSDAVQTRAERAMREAIEEIPDGDYPCEVTFDELDGAMTVGLVARVRGSDLEIDFVQVPPEHPYGGINCTSTYTRGHSCHALNCVLTPHIPGNVGLFRPIRFRIPEGTLLSCRHPVSVHNRTKIGWHVYDLLQGALAPAIPHKAPAPSALMSFYRLVGVDPEDVPFGELMVVPGGMGAGPTTDGVSGVCFPTSAGSVPIEFLETNTTTLWTEKEFLPDSGGPGRTRGGCGTRATVGRRKHLDRPVTLTAYCHGQGFPPFGLAGGRSASPARSLLNGVTLPIDEVRQVLGALDLDDPSIQVTMESPGGGGVGDAVERDPALVLADVRNGFVSVEAARRDYGVLVDLDTLTAQRLPRQS
ncbi:MAG: hydantoinase B/oxoprolinase family protein [Chloroflexi bacterium]|nr:hydantoinase B/oxoprolinase family protein [Chloroflexota bacterium]